MASEVEVHWHTDGSTGIQLLPRTAGVAYGYRQLVHPLDLGVAEAERFTTPIAFGPGHSEQGYVFNKSRKIVLTLHILGASERGAWSEWGSMNQWFRPDVLGKLRLKYVDHSLAVRDLYVEARRVVVPTPSWGSGHVQWRGKHTGGVLRAVIFLEALYPHWRSWSASTATKTGVSSTPSDLAITHDGDFPVGVRLTFANPAGGAQTLTAQNITSAPVGWSVDDGGTVTWDRGSAILDTDNVDWRHTDPSLVTWTAGSVTAGNNLVLWPGANTIRLSVDAGTVDVTVTYREAWS